MATPKKSISLQRSSAWQRLVDRLMPSRAPYRPERYYMRGPGPKCREKQAHAFAGSAAHRSA
jgi:hypothetical protein